MNEFIHKQPLNLTTDSMICYLYENLNRRFQFQTDDKLYYNYDYNEFTINSLCLIGFKLR
jgi:hypothetical protein